MAMVRLINVIAPIHIGLYAQESRAVAVNGRYVT